MKSLHTLFALSMSMIMANFFPPSECQIIKKYFYCLFSECSSDFQSIDSRVEEEQPQESERRTGL